MLRTESEGQNPKPCVYPGSWKRFMLLATGTRNESESTSIKDGLASGHYLTRPTAKPVAIAT